MGTNNAQFGELYGGFGNDLSEAGGLIDNAVFGIMGTGILILILVMAVMLIFVFKYSRKKRDRVSNIHGNFTLEAIWTIIPTILVMWMFWISWDAWAKQRHAGEKPQCSSPNVTCADGVAYQFGWDFYAKDSQGNRVNQTAATKLVVPEGRTVVLELDAISKRPEWRPVNHALWIPALRVKEDVVPRANRKLGTYTVFTPKKAGLYAIECTEFCGDGHSLMNSSLCVLPPADYDAWIAGGANGLPQACGGVSADASCPDKGKATFDGKCFACHKVDGGSVGPSMKDALKNATSSGDVAAYLRDALRDPNKVKAPGFENGVMPPFPPDQLSDADLDCVVEWIKSL